MGSLADVRRALGLNPTPGIASTRAIKRVSGGRTRSW